MVSVITVEEIKNLECTSARDDYLVIQFCSVEDVPAYDEGYIYDGARQDLFIKSYISQDLIIPGVMCREDFGHGSTSNADYEDYLRLSKTVRQIGRMSDYHFTLRKHDEGRAIWNSYHNFKMKPPKDGLISLELFHASRKASMQAAERAMHHGETADAAHGLVGSVHIALDMLTDTPQRFLFSQANKRFPNFSVTLRRVYTEVPPLRIKTFFLIRHGESKWNIAQETNNVRGMLHRDHSLTKVGTNQAIEFNESWRKYCRSDQSTEEVHAEEVSNYPTKITAKHQHHKNVHPPPAPPSPTSGKGSIDLTELSLKAQSAAPAPAPVELPKKPGFLSSLVPGFLKKKQPAPQALPTHHILVSRASTTREDEIEDTRSRSSSLDLNHTHYYQDGDHDHHHSSGGRGGGGSNCGGGDGGSDDADKSKKVLTQKRKSKKRLGSTDDAEDEDSDTERTDSEGEEASPRARDQGAGGDDDDDDDEVEFGHRNGIREKSVLADVHKILKVPTMLVQRRVEYIQQFMAADGIYVSPLTRAVQTSLFTLYTHPALVDGITIMSTLREYKGPGGLDTVGMVVGAAIKDRVFQETADIVSKEEAELKTNVPFHVSDAELHWWTDFNHYEGKRAMNDRMCEFLDFAQFCEAKTPIFVGHSNFFRYFYSNYLSEVVEYNRPALCHDLRQFRLANACCLAVTVLFEEDEEEENDVPSAGTSIDASHKSGSAVQTRGSHHEARSKHVARIIDADIVFTDHRLSFANGNKAAPEAATATTTASARAPNSPQESSPPVSPPSADKGLVSASSVRSLSPSPSNPN